MKLWSEREPHFYSSGSSDRQPPVRDAFAAIALIERAEAVALIKLTHGQIEFVKTSAGESSSSLRLKQEPRIDLDHPAQ